MTELVINEQYRNNDARLGDHCYFCGDNKFNAPLVCMLSEDPALHYAMPCCNGCRDEQLASNPTAKVMQCF